MFDGETALEYARSRHTTSDFDRSERQQVILSALKAKLIELGYLSKPSKIKELFVAFGENFETNLTITQLIQAASIVRSVPDHLVYKANLNDSCNLGVTACEPGGLLYPGSRELM